MTEKKVKQDIEQAYQNLRTSLRSYLRKHVSENDIDDLLHEIFLKLLNNLKSGKKIDKLSHWLFTVAKTTVIDYYRKQKPTAELPDDLADNLVSDKEQEAEEQGLSNCIKPLTQQLPKLYRDTLLAHEFKGVSLKTIAKESNLSHSAIKSRASRARRLLKEKLAACCRLDMTTGEIECCYETSECGQACAATAKNT